MSPVVGQHTLDDGTVAVEFALSHAVHRLPRGAADYETLERDLRRAVETGAPIVVVEDDNTHEVIHVVDFVPDPESPPPRPFPRPTPDFLPEPKMRRWWLRLWYWPWWPWCWILRWWWRCLSPTKAQQIFDVMNAQTCDPVAVPSPCIPFKYPDNGCWARAHEMCRIMIAMGLEPDKVWIRRAPGKILHVNTANNPNCFVEWWYHVAPIVCVRRPWWTTQSMVLDPSMFTTPVTKAGWKTAANEPTASLTDTDASVYRPYGGTDPTYLNTNADLATYRLELHSRAVSPAGPPPYNCP